MKDVISSLLEQNKNNKFLKNTIELRCKCGFSEKITYYDFLSGREFEKGKPVHTISPFISESIYDEMISVTPLQLSRKCPSCNEDIIIVFPISLENIIPMLQSKPPDLLMYG